MLPCFFSCLLFYKKWLLGLFKMFLSLILKNLLKKQIDMCYVQRIKPNISTKDEYLEYLNNSIDNNLVIDCFWNHKSYMLSLWFDENYYKLHYGKTTVLPPLIHFITKGYTAKKFGSKLHENIVHKFVENFYLNTYKDINSKVWSKNTLEHFLTYGVSEHRSINQIFNNLSFDFDDGYYAKKYIIPKEIAWGHYITEGYLLDNDINEEFESLKNCFNKDFYLSKIEASKLGDMTPFFHFIAIGSHQEIPCNSEMEKIKKFFDANFYNAKYYLNNYHIKGYAHYIKYGFMRDWFVNNTVFKNKDLLELFNPNFYLSMYKDLSKVSDLYLHYVAHGIKEGRYGNINQIKKNCIGKIPFMHTFANTPTILDSSISKSEIESLSLTQLISYKNDLNKMYWLDKLLEITNISNNILVFTHCAGGGAELYLKNKLSEFLNDKIDYLFNKSKKICKTNQNSNSSNNLVFIVRYNHLSNKYSLEVKSLTEELSIKNIDIEVLLLLKLNIKTIFINSLFKYPETLEYNIKDTIINIKSFQNSKMIFLGHDFDLINITPSMTDGFDAYANNDFYTANNIKSDKSISIIDQRINTQKLLNNCDNYVFFSHNTIDLFKKVVTLDEKKLVYQPHNLNFKPEDFAKFFQNLDLPNLNKFTVAVCGNIEKHKGADIIQAFAKLCLETKINLTILIIGNYVHKPLSNTIVTGNYNNDSLPEILSIYRPNCFFFSSIWDETFSYVAHDLQLSKVPIICFNLGAQAETIKDYDKGFILDEISEFAVYNKVIDLYLTYQINKKQIINNKVEYLYIDRKSKIINNKISTQKNVAYTIYLNILSDSQDYMSWIKNIALLTDITINLSILVPENIDFTNNLNIINSILPNNVNIKLTLTKNGNGLWCLYNRYQKLKLATNKVLYVSAFDENTTSLEKWYTIEYLLGHDSNNLKNNFINLTQKDTIILDNYFEFSTNKFTQNRISKTLDYMNERADYCPFGYLKNYLTQSNLLPKYNGLYLNLKSLDILSQYFLKEYNVYFSDISDNALITLLFSSKVNNLNISVLTPRNVIKYDCTTQRDLFKKWCVLNFNANNYIEKNADIKNDVNFATNHFTNFGFDENRDYCDYLSIDILKKCLNTSSNNDPTLNKQLTQKEIDYYFAYKDAAVARYIFDLDIDEYQVHIANSKSYVKDIYEYNDFNIKYEDNKVSFLVPIYNSEEFLRNCLDSIYNVDYPNFEVVLCDDGSQDNSTQIIKEYEDKYPNNTITIFHEQNKCFAKTHKDLINKATGKYFTIIDADDYIAKDYAKVFVKLMEYYQLDVGICSWTRPNTLNAIISESKGLITPIISTSKDMQRSIGNWTNSAIPNIHYGLNRKFYNKESFIKCNPITIDESHAFNEDFSVTLKLFSNERLKVGIIKNRLYAWFNNLNSVSYASISERVIHDILFTFISDLNNVVTKYPNYVSQITSCLEKHLFKGLNNITNKFILRKRIILVASILDSYSILLKNFDKSILVFLKRQFNILCYKSIDKQNILKYSQKVAIIDSIGHSELKNCLLDELDRNNIDYYYNMCSKQTTFKEQYNFIKEVNACALIVTDGGWGQDELVTNLTIINTWHGMGALKYVSRFPEGLQPTIGFSSSKEVNFCYRWMYNLPNNKIMTVGNLVATKLLDKEYLVSNKKIILTKIPFLKNKKIYLWVPTFRGTEPNYRLMDPLYDFSQISQQLKEDEVFLIKWHPCLKYFSADILPDLSIYKNIIDVTDEDLIELYSITSVCLTDYSSCIFYASLLNIPIGIIATDINEYTENRGFYIDIRTEMPSNVFEGTSTTKLLDYIRTRDVDSKQYQDFREKHVGGVQEHVEKTICSLIKSMITNNINLL